MKNKIVIITVCVVLCLALLPLSSFTVSAAASYDPIIPTGVTSVIDLNPFISHSLSNLGENFDASAYDNWKPNYNFTPNFYVCYTVQKYVSSGYNDTQFVVTWNDVLDEIPASSLVTISLQFAVLHDQTDVYFVVRDANGVERNARFHIVTTPKNQVGNFTIAPINSYTVTSLFDRETFDGLVAPFDFILTTDFPTSYESVWLLNGSPSGTLSYTEGLVYAVPFSGLFIESDYVPPVDPPDESSEPDESSLPDELSHPDEPSQPDTSDDTSGGDTPGGGSGGSGGGYDDTELLNRVDELLNSVETTNQTLVSINLNLTDAPLYLVNKIENAKLQIESEKLNQDKIEDGLNDLEFPDQNEQNQLLNNFANAFNGFDSFVEIGGSDGATLREVWAAIWGWEFCVAAVGLVASMIVIHKIMFG